MSKDVKLTVVDAEKSLNRHFLLRQVCAVIGSGLHNVGQMTTWCIPSVVFVKSVEGSSDADANTLMLNTEQISWFASLPLLMAIPGSFIGGMLTEYFGPRKFQLMMAPVLSILLAGMQIASLKSIQDAGLASDIIMAIRVMQSVATGTVISVVCQYPCEIADTKRRGLLGSLADFWGYLGFVVVYVTSYFLPWTTLTWLLPMLSFLPSSILLLGSPESPIWLVKKGRYSEASQALRCIRKSEKDVIDELGAMQFEIGRDKTNAIQSLLLLMEKKYAKPVAIASTMLALKEFIGNIAIAFFMVDIFKLADSKLDPILCSIIVGCVRTTSNLAGAFLLYRLPRKTILLTGVSVVGLVNFFLGLVYFLNLRGIDVSHVNWIPLMLLMLFMIGYGLGIGTPTWLISTEILPNSVRCVGCGIVFTMYSLAGFIAAKTFHVQLELIGMHGIFWFYCTACFIFGIFAFFVVPETRGLSLTEIEELWKT